jgi:glucokinase
MTRERLGDAVPSSAYGVALLTRSGSQEAHRVFDTVGSALAVALTGLINTLNLPLYLLGGGVCDAWDLFSPSMFRELEARSYVYRLTKPQMRKSNQLEARKTYILRAELGPEAELLGACILGLEQPTAILSPGKDLFVP